MRIRMFLPLVLVLSFMLMACQQNETATAPMKLAVVDMARIMRDSEPGKTGLKFLEEQQKAMQADLNEVQAKLEKDKDNAELQQELQAIYMSSQQRMQAEQQNVVNLLYDLIQRTLNTYRQKQGYEVVLTAEVAASFDSKADITEALIAEVNKEKVDFKPVSAPKAEAADGKKDDAKAEKADKKSDAKAEQKK